MIRFCTYFDGNYLVRGVTLCRSILRYIQDCEIWVLCLDGWTESALRALALPQLRVIGLARLEAVDRELAATASGRGLIEYYFTATPSWCRYVLDQAELDDIVCYVDADIMFYQTPHAALEEMGTGSVLIMPHRFPPESNAARTRGIYNVGLIAFRNDQEALRCLDRWRMQCLEACWDLAVDGRYADQSYLDDWPSRFDHVVVSQRLGSCLAPWNVGQYRVNHGNPIRVNGQPLTFYHFHGLTIFSDQLWDSGLREYGYSERNIVRTIYVPYLRELRSSVRLLRENGVDVRLRDWVWRRRRRSLPAMLRKLFRAKVFAFQVRKANRAG